MTPKQWHLFNSIVGTEYALFWLALACFHFPFRASFFNEKIVDNLFTLCLFPCNNKVRRGGEGGGGGGQHSDSYGPPHILSDWRLWIRCFGGPRCGLTLRRQVDTVTSTLSCQTPWLGPRFFIQSRRHRQLHVSRPLGGRLPMYA